MIRAHGSKCWCLKKKLAGVRETTDKKCFVIFSCPAIFQSVSVSVAASWITDDLPNGAYGWSFDTAVVMVALYVIAAICAALSPSKPLCLSDEKDDHLPTWKKPAF